MPHPTATKLLEWVSASFPDDVTLLRGPAAPEALAHLQEVTGCPLPAALDDLWRAHDGQNDNPRRAVSYPPIFERFYWSSVEEAAREVTAMKEVMEDVRRTFAETDPWPNHWLPFASDSGGGMLVVDLLRGEVFEYQRDGDGREAMWGETFDDFVDKYLAQFAKGDLRVDPVEGVVDTRQVSLREPPAPPRAENAKLVLAAVFVVLLLIALALFWMDLQRHH